MGEGREKIILELHVTETDQDNLIQFLLSAKIPHNIYDFAIGSIGQFIKK